MLYSWHIIGERIRKNRKEKGLSQEQLAEYLEQITTSPTKRQTVAGWENGKPVKKIEQLTALCEIFDCDMAYVLGIDAEIETRIEADVSSKYADSVFISYLSTLGIDVEIVPLTASDGIDVEANLVKPEIEYGYQVFYKNEEKHCYDEMGWIEFQDKVSKLIKLIL